METRSNIEEIKWTFKERNDLLAKMKLVFEEFFFDDDFIF